MGNDLKSKTVGDYFTLQRGTTYKSKLLGLPGPILLGLATIQRNGGFRDDSLRTYGGDSPNKLLVHSGELYLSLKDVTQSADLLGAVARLPHTQNPGRLTQDTVRLIPRTNDIPSSYLYWLLRTPQYREYCRAHSTGTTTLGLSREDFLAFPVPEPQRNKFSIVTILDNTESKIELLRSMNETLEAMARALFKSWFVDFDPVRKKAEGRPTGLPPEIDALFPDSFEDSELGEIPKGWNISSVREQTEIIYGKALKEENRIPGSVVVFGSNGVVGRHNEALDKAPGVVVGRKGNPGFVKWTNDDYFVIDTAFYIKPISHLSKYYFFWAFLDLDLPRLSSDSAVPGISRDSINQCQILVPLKSIIDSFDLDQKRFQKLMHSNDQEIRTIISLRDSLLPKLISGELELSDQMIKKLLESTK